ncbi:MAG TPA: MFS transporter [Steroidobacteraceae bacterium]|nr:MFS transporter [Steroidobacteraceae bacterium]
MKTRPGLALAVHALIRIAASADGVLVGLSLAQLRREHGGVPVSLAGVLGAVAYGLELMASVPAGLAADAFSPRGVMALGALIGASGTWLFSFTTRLPLLIVSRMLQGLGVAAVTPPLLTWLARVSAGAPARRARLMSFFELSMLGGVALGGLVGSRLWTWLGRAAFGALALVGLSSAPLLYASAGRMPPGEPRAALIGLRQALRHPAVQRLAPSWVCINAIVGLWLGPTLAFLLTEPSRSHQYLDGLFAARPTDFGWLMLGYTLVFGIGVALWSLLLPRVHARSVWRVSLAAMLAVCALLFAFNHSADWSRGPRGALLGGAALLIVVESGFTPAALSYLAQALEPISGKGAAMGLYSLLLGVGAVAGSLLAAVCGALWQIDGLLLGTALLTVIALGVLPRGERSFEPIEQAA